MSRLDEIVAREAAASPGPWTKTEEYDPRSPLDHEGCDVWPWTEKADMEFAYAARTDVPLLLRVALAARKVLAASVTADENGECRSCFGLVRHSSDCVLGELQTALDDVG